MVTIKERVKQIVESKLGIVPRDEDKFKADLGADSLDLLDVIMECEKEFGIVIPDDAISHKGSVQDLIDYVESHVQEG